MQLEPKYHIQFCNDHQAIIVCQFDADYPYFSGHFPNMPILAGVIQLGLVYHFVEKIWHMPLYQATINQLKYQHLVHPDSELKLSLNYFPEKRRLEFKWLLSDTIVSSGVFSL